MGEKAYADGFEGCSRWTIFLAQWIEKGVSISDFLAAVQGNMASMFNNQQGYYHSELGSPTRFEPLTPSQPHRKYSLSGIETMEE